jgi:hypothetical protein
MILAGTLAAQGTPQATPAKESFVIEPATLQSGVQNATIRLVSNTPSGFSNSSSKPPAVKFSAGVALVTGSFSILNQNESECRVNVERDTVGTIEVSVELFSVNGSKVLKTLRGTLGITGVQDVAGSQAKVGVESVRLVRVNVPDPQPAGTIVISGKIAGSVLITAPTGTSFFEAPKVSTSAGGISGPKLEASNTVFTFNIGNAGSDDLTVRVTDIRYSTALFASSGGVEGDLAVEISGGALSNQSALVINAFTAKATVDGSNDVQDDAPANDSESSDSTDESSPTAAPSNVNTGNRRELDAERERNNRNRENRDNTRNPGTTPGRSVESGRPSSRGPGQVPRAPNAPPAQGGAQGQPAGAQPVAPGRGENPLLGTGSAGEEPGDGTSKLAPGDKPAKDPDPLVVTPGLNFCDKDFKPVTAVVLDRIVAGEAGGRIWIELRLAKDRDPEKAESVTVKLTVAGTMRELTLNETDKNTGVFRCAKEGVLLVAQENPDSNEPEAANIAPKPRYTGR